MPRAPPFRGPIHSYAYFDCGNGQNGTRYNTYTYSRDNAGKFLPSFNTEVDSDQMTSEIKEWLSTCDCKAGGNSRFRPTRLLFIGEDEQNRDVTVQSTEGLKIPSYVCLSYCWGGPQALTCTSSEFQSSQSWAVPHERIPATFRDAFKTARLLGFRHIWIDSLCIIQDDPLDLRNEILKMPDIFKYADLTICASSSGTCTDGFLQQRPDYSEMKIPLSLPGGTLGAALFDSFTWWDPPVPEPLAERAWAFQERLLSPRLLEYGWRTARWSCSCCSSYSGYTPLAVAEDATRDPRDEKDPSYYSLFSYLNPPGIRDFTLLSSNLFESWTRIVRAYSSRKLTFPDDRLAALSGVAIEIQRATGAKYLAGLWHHQKLPLFLLWRTVDPLPRRRIRPSQDRAPSWSWAAIDEAVIYQHSEVLVESFEMGEVHVSGTFERSVQGSMEMTGPVRHDLVLYGSGSVTLDSAEPHVTVSMRGGNDLMIWPDCDGEVVEFFQGRAGLVEVELTLIAIGRAHTNNKLVRGLVLLKNHLDANGAYKRVGMFQVADEGAFLVADWDVEKLVVE